VTKTVPARISFEARTELRDDTEMAEVPLGEEATWADKAPWAGEAAETHEKGESIPVSSMTMSSNLSMGFLGFDMLQRLNIANLQYKLAEIKVIVGEAGQFPFRLVSTYCRRDIKPDYRGCSLRKKRQNTPNFPTATDSARAFGF
jgi:hypothetical protein